MRRRFPRFSQRIAINPQYVKDNYPWNGGEPSNPSPNSPMFQRTTFFATPFFGS
jgi:hypothetical protein